MPTTTSGRAQDNDDLNPAQVCAAGLEWRDYPTLLSAGRADARRVL